MTDCSQLGRAGWTISSRSAVPSACIHPPRRPVGTFACAVTKKKFFLAPGGEGQRKKSPKISCLVPGGGARKRAAGGPKRRALRSSFRICTRIVERSLWRQVMSSFVEPPVPRVRTAFSVAGKGLKPTRGGGRALLVTVMYVRRWEPQLEPSNQC